MIRNLLKIT